jgi:hypothetical protein
VLSRLLPFAKAALLLGAMMSPVLAQNVTATADYAISLGGNNVANLTIRLADGGGHYELEANARITGMASLVASGSGKVKSTGISTAAGLTSQRFDFLTSSQGEDFTVLVTYANKDVESFVVTPPLLNNIDRVAIERKHLRNVNDMVAAFVLKGGELDKGLCNRKMQIFTGLERFNVALQFAKADEATSKRTGYQGPVILCNIRYSPISGHFTTSEVTNYLKDSDRILIWYAPLKAPGMFIPYRILLTTSMWDLSMVLTRLVQ